MSKDTLPFPLSAFPTAAEISLLLEAGRTQVGEAEGPEATLDEYIQEACLEAWRSLATWATNFVYFVRDGERADRPETSKSNDMNAVFSAPGASWNDASWQVTVPRGCWKQQMIFHCHERDKS